VDGKPVEDASELQMAVGLKSPGDKVNLEVMRDGKSQNYSLNLAALDDKSDNERASNGTHDKARWGVGLTDVSGDARSELQLSDDLKGALVANVQPGSPADNAGLRRGDVILQVNRKDTKSAADAKQALTTIQDGQDALLLVHSNGGNTYRVMHPTEDNNS
jgi:S1-C subfamily serine protease